MTSARSSRATLDPVSVIAALALAVLVSPVALAETVPHEPAAEEAKAASAGMSATEKPAPPSYYEDEVERRKQRGLSQREVDQAQDRYYDQQSKDAEVRRKKMDSDAEKYYGRP